MAFILLFAERADEGRVTRLTLEHAGHEVLTFTDPQALLAALPDVSPVPRLLVFDVSARRERPPLWAKVRQLPGWSQVPVLLVCEGTPDADTVPGGSPDDVLPKPYALKDLVYRASRLLSRQPEPV